MQLSLLKNYSLPEDSYPIPKRNDLWSSYNRKFLQVATLIITELRRAFADHFFHELYSQWMHKCILSEKH